ncbi:hypothetical protein BH18THE1_BH18THE1_08140 [soil metagenome]
MILSSVQKRVVKILTKIIPIVYELVALLTGSELLTLWFATTEHLHIKFIFF